MLAKKVKLRISFLFFSLLILFVIFFLILKSLEKNLVYFFSPSEIYLNSDISFDKKIRIGGLVKQDSVEKKDTIVEFIITDLKNEIIVTYEGMVPNLFSEGKGVVAEGKLRDKKYFIATTILAKHDENYMPPEVIYALDKSK
jgi:cytochrome c-type biogenesis protein CcmE